MAISDKKIKNLQELMKKLEISESEIEESFVAGAKKGGQKANKSSVVVHLKHLPSSIIIKCAKSRAREENRFFARRLLAEKVASMKGIKNEMLLKQSRKIEKIKKQKKRRTRRSSSSQ